MADNNSVKFIRLGFNTPVTPAKYADYKVDGNIVFAKVAEKGTWSTDKFIEPLLYIWANNIEYKIPDQAALEYVIDLVNTLNANELTVGSVDYKIKEALTSYKPKAEDILDLIDSSNSNVTVELTDSSMLKVNVHKATITTGSELPTTGDFQHGDYFIVETYLKKKQNESGEWIVDASAEPRRMAYIWDETKNEGEGAWVALDGNVDATNVYFADGIDRTVTFGVQTKEDDTIINEGKDMNLKELLEYYLVKEVYESGVATNASFLDPTFSLTPATGTTPSNLYSYVKVDDTQLTSATALAEVSTAISVSAISLTEKYSYTATASQTGIAPVLTYDKYDKYSTDGTTIIDGTTYTGITPSATYSYTDTLSTATATLTLDNVSGCTGIDDATNTITDVTSGTALSLSADSGVIVEGENKLTLSYNVSGATATRKVENHTNAENISAYGISNKNNVSTGTTTATGFSINTTDTTINTTRSYVTSSVTVTGVYQIYTDGGSVKTAATNKADGSYSDDPLTFGNINYFTSTKITRYVQFGACNAGTVQKHEIYLPQSGYKNFTITRGDYFNPLESATDKYTDGQTDKWVKTSETKVINGVTYDIWRNSKTNGANECCIEITVANK